ncbi:acetoin utilization protein AcuC [Lysinibacillus sphaericus]|uniref:Acetoin utilization protein AcuC n=3 Tax=Lysinibacillus TaxID=400634 RepID=A0A2S0JXJ4_LYSSH|nr:MULTISPECIES: acetoin utilization protein AcuC [Lysinibacillus]AVK95863.1 acetoin utilization protein AcuC [Lysinibacillus sphaericus]MCS1380638.1 acetoin utilization protein AcuC [Lysinibacillus sphaericus]MED4544939.1 acetoin utilization protein AcuC [Lysinibacillus sphaericus]TKI21599.1 acetoin utilization protein AcuC [Lysinibacillus sphaericus]TKI49727.1 acetoin utilization protein AcuC [Lysinibacillus tabacifolii]
MKKAVFVYSPEQLGYKFSDTHPFNHKRLTLTMDLLKNIGALDDVDIVPARIATEEELLLAHDPKYIEIVKNAGHGKLSEAQCASYGIGTEDTPIFKNMHEASAQLVGGTLTAVDYVMEGKAEHALNLGGGLHHGFRGRASGFCIYNDSTVAIRYLQDKYKARVLYVDTDAHHGDGVQWSFYDDPDVCTLSIHETGRYLFPGTGNITERGNGQGYGTSFNFPIDAFTEDDSFLDIYEQAMREVFEFFKPDVVLTQNGADAHYFDPLTHLYGTMNIYKEIPKLAHKLAHEYCDGKWIAVGGGGYDIWRVVPRAWSMLWLEMTDQEKPSGPLPQAWLERWQPEAPVPFIPTWEDPNPLYEPIPRKAEIEEKNAQMLEKALHIIRTEKRS